MLLPSFGDIPVIICTDLQSPPQEVPAFQVVSALDEWFDPLAQVQQEDLSRPITFSRTCNFLNPEDNFSSIDAILMNKVAITALRSIQPMYCFGRQHAPIQAVFTWESVLYKGFILNKPAPLKFDALPKCDGIPDPDFLEATANSLWNQDFERDCFQDDSTKAWESINNFALKTFVNAGATFGCGAKTRGAPPEFSVKAPCAGQLFDGSAATSRTIILEKLINRIAELRKRVSRDPGSFADQHATRLLVGKIYRILSNLKLVHIMPTSPFTDQNLCDVQRFVQQLLTKQKLQDKTRRIANWKKTMMRATQSMNVDKCVFTWLRNKSQTTTCNYIINKDGNILFDPRDAIAEINSVWDDVYSANAGLVDPHKVLSAVWPHVDAIRKPTNLPSLTGRDLKNQVILRKATAAPGLDGWRTQEAQALPEKCFDVIASFFTQIETGARDAPKQLSQVRQVLLPKDGAEPGSPLGKRIIVLLSVFVLAYSGLRFRQLQEWQSDILPFEITGGVKNRFLSSIPLQLRLDLDAAGSTHDLIGVKIDKSKAFDRIVPSIAGMLMLAFGIQKEVVNFFLQRYSRMERYTCLDQWIAPSPLISCHGLVQGCSFSILCMNLQMAVWVLLLKSLPITKRAYIDDAYIWCSLQKSAELQKAMEITTSCFFPASA